jgi:TRAP-type mannitol/chloroaromatic compound transport system substrate-binding protein
MGGWFRKEINTVADLNGLKFRIAGFAGSVIKRLGVVPQQVAPGDIFPALENGTIDAVEWVGPYDDEKLGFYKIAKYYYYPGWWEGGTTAHLLINRARWDSLSKTYQSIMTAASREAGLRLTAKYDLMNPPAMKRLIAAGTELRAFSPEIMDASFRVANDTYAELGNANTRFRKILDSLMAFRRDSYSWWQVAELSFDVFQVKTLGRV